MKRIISYLTEHEPSNYICIVLCSVAIGFGAYHGAEAIGMGDASIIPATIAILLCHAKLWIVLGDKEAKDD